MGRFENIGMIKKKGGVASSKFHGSFINQRTRGYVKKDSSQLRIMHDFLWWMHFFKYTSSVRKKIAHPFFLNPAFQQQHYMHVMIASKKEANLKKKPF